MRAFAGVALLTAGWLSASAGTASAAWNNVFQTTCRSCQSAPPPRSSFFAPAPAAACCPTVTYQQRCYYQPYTAYRQQSYYEPVTTYRTSYYWEGTTSYRYTSYYDPCTGCCSQVATPYTSYQLRSQCNAVQSYVQRCAMVPYTAYRQSCYMEPTVSYSAPVCPTCPTCPTGGCPTGGCPTGNCPTAPNAGVSEPPPASQPARPNAGVSEDNRTLPPQNIPNNYQRATPAPAPAPQFRGDRVASYSAPTNGGRLAGTVVSDDRITPKGGARIVFTSVVKQAERYSAQADATGQFNIDLPAGEWNLSMVGADGRSVFHSQIDIRNNDQRLVTVVSR